MSPFYQTYTAYYWPDLRNSFFLNKMSAWSLRLVLIWPEWDHFSVTVINWPNRMARESRISSHFIPVATHLHQICSLLFMPHFTLINLCRPVETRNPNCNHNWTCDGAENVEQACKLQTCPCSRCRIVWHSETLPFKKRDFGWRLIKLDAGQSPTLARPAAPLAACVQRHPCTKTNNISLS